MNCKEKGIIDSINSMATDVRNCSVLILVDLSGVRPLAALHASIFGQDVQETPSFPQCLHYTVYQDVNDRKYSHTLKYACVNEVMRPDEDCVTVEKQYKRTSPFIISYNFMLMIFSCINLSSSPARQVSLPSQLFSPD